MTNKIIQHYQTCSDLQCPLFNIQGPCEALKTGKCQYQTIQILQNAPETNQTLNGKLHGKYREWYEDGNLYTESNYVDGERHGLYREFYRDGNLYAECNYIDGERHGLYREFYREYIKNGRRRRVIGNDW